VNAASKNVPVVLLMGPTGAGKTDLAIDLAERFPVEIVSVDSAMVYRGLDIGSGKPPPDMLARYPHHLVDILDPLESYSAGQFVRDARRAIDDIHARGKVPLLVGGTMLYFRALRRGLAELPTADAQTRAEIDAQGAARGWPAMHAVLAEVDARAASRIQPNDAQRIQRALEVFRLTGRPLSEIQAATPLPDPSLRFSAIAWVPGDRERLYAGIEARFHRMMAAGLLEEVRRLYQRGDLHDRLPAIRCVGYRQLWEHFAGVDALESAVQRAVVATRHLARRQLIWLRSESELDWVDSLDSAATAHIQRQLASLCSEATPY
jgi:tRNA dimethylallyltransferase